VFVGFFWGCVVYSLGVWFFRWGFERGFGGLWENEGSGILKLGSKFEGGGGKYRVVWGLGVGVEKKEAF